MRKYLKYFLSFTLLLSLISCGSTELSTPESTINSFCSNIQKSNYDKAYSSISDSIKENPLLSSLENLGLFNGVLGDYIKQNNNKMTYEIDSINEKDGKQKVVVSFSYNSGADILNTALDNYLSELKQSLNKDTEITTEQSYDIFAKNFLSASNSIKSTTNSQEVTFYLEKNNGNYLITNVSENFFDVFTNDFASTYKNYN